GMRRARCRVVRWWRARHGRRRGWHGWGDGGLRERGGLSGMRHRVGQRKLGRPTGHRLALIRNLMTDLLRHERLRTTEPKASELRREVEKLIGSARAGDLH